MSGTVFEFCRYLMQHTPLLFLIAGTQKLRELTGGTWSVFFNLATPIDIGMLGAKDARWLINVPVQRWYAVAERAQDEIIRVAGCHPYFTQLVCKKLLEVRNEFEVTVVTSNHVGTAIDRALQTGEDQIGYPWTEPDCRPDERLILAALAREGREGTPTPVSHIRQLLEEAGFNVAVGEAVHRLVLREVLRQDAEERLTFAVPLFQNWIVRKRYDTLTAAARYNEEHPVPGLGRGNSHG
jgi:hypothetical protein